MAMWIVVLVIVVGGLLVILEWALVICCLVRTERLFKEAQEDVPSSHTNTSSVADIAM